MAKKFNKNGKKSGGKKAEGKTKAAVAAAERIGYTIGKHSGTGVVATWNALLKANRKEKLTDDQLLDKMQAEFPDREKFQPVARIRSWYNNGRYGLGLGEDKKQLLENRSVPYDNDGNVQKRIPFGGKDRATQKKLKAKKRTTEKSEAAAA